MADGRSHGARPLARSPEDLRVLHQLCRDGRLYDVERWVAEGKPLQVAPHRPMDVAPSAVPPFDHEWVSNGPDPDFAWRPVVFRSLKRSASIRPDARGHDAQG
jgi:hypothetical protein